MCGGSPIYNSWMRQVSKGEGEESKSRRESCSLLYPPHLRVTCNKTKYSASFSFVSGFVYSIHEQNLIKDSNHSVSNFRLQ